MTEQIQIPGSRFLHLKEPNVLAVETRNFAGQGRRLALMFQRDEQLVLITLTEDTASELMGALETQFCNDPNCPRHSK